MSAWIDITGQRFGLLRAIEPVFSPGMRHRGWFCICDCGGAVVKSGSDLRTGNTGSCGCMRDACRKSLPPTEAAFRYLYREYQDSARARGHAFDLSRDEFRRLTRQDCLYCGVLPGAVVSRPRINGSYIYNGVDRVDNTKGYIVDNCVACCKTCNLMKRMSSVGEFLSHIERIHKHQHTT